MSNQVSKRFRNGVHVDFTEINFGEGICAGEGCNRQVQNNSGKFCSKCADRKSKRSNGKSRNDRYESRWR